MMTTKPKTRWILAVLLAGAMLALAAGIAYAASRPAATAEPAEPNGAAVATAMPQACDRMHDTPAMRRLHAQMPAQARQQCDQMHEQMQQMMGGTMMSGGIMDGDHASMGPAGR